MQAEACSADPACADRLSGAASNSDGSCERVVPSCSDIVDNAYCLYEDSCSTNSFLVSWLGERYTASNQNVVMHWIDFGKEALEVCMFILHSG